VYSIISLLFFHVCSTISCTHYLILDIRFNALSSCHNDKNVASCFLNKIPGRSGVITILGKECEVKASEPKTHQDEFADRRDAYNYAKPRPMIVTSKLPSLQSSSSSSHQGWFDLMPSNNQPTQPPPHKNSSMFENNSRSGSGFGGGGNTFPHQLHVNQALLIPPNIDNGGGRGGGGVSIYSHSTITRSSTSTTTGPSRDGDTTVYIQNNFYLIPPGTAMTVPPNHANTISPEQLQAKQMAEFVRAATPMQYAVSSSLHPSYPGPGNVNSDEKDWAAAAIAAAGGGGGGGRHVSFSPPKEVSSYAIWQQK
jgi:hypothetical protein